ncbi:histone-lysine N-methyltransferase PRDM9-like isoform X1 [Vespula squamosa]|uniref:Histone-lysine N-methyltransferase PRDM9-like isoform X1 n=1 Tax=Vespula squamosa TaxID=30214 RepID=A0ABD2BM64_VESSQ
MFIKMIRTHLSQIYEYRCGLMSSFHWAHSSIRFRDQLDSIRSICTPFSMTTTREYGCYDEVFSNYNLNKRQCNWIRFLHIIQTDDEQVNLIGTKVKGEPIFEVIKDVQPDTELVAWFPPITYPDFIFISHDMCLRSALYRCLIDSIVDGESKILLQSCSSISDVLESPLDLSMALLSHHISPSIQHSYYEPDEYESTSEESSSSTLSLVGDHLDCSILTTIKRGDKVLLPCEVCGKSFDRPSLLKRHTRTHTGKNIDINNLHIEKPHKCLQCSKSFPTPGDLKSHMYVHNGLWPFRCQICNRGFSKPTNLKNHMLLHLGRCSNKKFIESIPDL